MLMVEMRDGYNDGQLVIQQLVTLYNKVHLLTLGNVLKNMNQQ